MGNRIFLNKEYDFYGLITINVDSIVVNLGAKIKYSPVDGFTIHAVIEEYNQKYTHLEGLEILEDCDAYLFNEIDDEIQRCTFYDIFLSSKFNSMSGTCQDLTLYPRICIFNTYGKELKINEIQIFLPFWNEFFFPKMKNKTTKYCEVNEIFNIGNGWKLEFTESASYNIIDKEDLNKYFIDLEGDNINFSEDIKYLKPKSKHIKYLLLKPEIQKAMDSESIGSILREIYKLRNFLSILFNMKINMERIVFRTEEDGRLDALYSVNNNEMIKYDFFIYQFLPIKYSDIKNFDEIISKYYDLYDSYEPIIEIMNQNIDEKYTKYHYSRTSDCLKEIGTLISKNEPYRKAIETIAIKEIKDEIEKIFNHNFGITDWKEIGKKISYLRALITHFNNNKIDVNIEYYSLMYNLTSIFSVIIKAHILKNVGMKKNLIVNYEKYHFEHRKTMKTIKK